MRMRREGVRGVRMGAGERVIREGIYKFEVHRIVQ